MYVNCNRLCCTSTGTYCRTPDDRIAVLVNRQEKLPNVSNGTGGDAGSTCVDLAHEHHLPERMKGLSLDTSTSNAGIREPASGKRRLSGSNLFT